MAILVPKWPKFSNLGHEFWVEKIVPGNRFLYGPFPENHLYLEKLVLLYAWAGSTYKFKKTKKSKIGRFGPLLGLNFGFFFTGLGLSEGCRRPNRAAATLIGQQNQPGHLKLSVLDGKTGKYTDFDFAKIKPDFLDAQFVTSWVYIPATLRSELALLLVLRT